MYNHTLIKTYTTQAGHVGADVFKNNASDTFAYIGKWGAGSGLDADTMAKQMKLWETSKKKFTVQSKES